jgi:hypothetical protein
VPPSSLFSLPSSFALHFTMTLHFLFIFFHFSPRRDRVVLMLTPFPSLHCRFPTHTSACSPLPLPVYMYGWRNSRIPMSRQALRRPGIGGTVNNPASVKCKNCFTRGLQSVSLIRCFS